ncbi:hypothetical protein T01_9319 [Trichinella spiralis]|uniref:Uncharacterized protein n=1 Tax=Trichinella spiralis TaxID=6334 RepID=A0A0V1BIG8_TRISP|nr:hypothetical protein T01_9319 [Trichinella spiralis]
MQLSFSDFNGSRRWPASEQMSPFAGTLNQKIDQRTFCCFSMDVGQRLLEIGELLLPQSGITVSPKPRAVTLSRSI